MEGYRKVLGLAPQLHIAIGINVAQFLSFIVNLAFAVIGTLLILLTYPAQWVSLRYNLFVEFGAFNPVIVLILTGVVMFIISIFGGIATIARRSFIVNLYVILLLVLLVVEINVGITTFIVHGNIKSSIKSNMIDSLNNKTEAQSWSYIMSDWDYMQNQLSCCGIHEPYDWAPLHIDGPKVNDNGVTHTVPYSCCPNYFERNKECYVIRNGCLDVINDYVSTTSGFIGYLALAIVISQILGLACAFLLLGNIRHLKTAEEMKRQEIQHLIYTDLHKPEDEKPLLTSSSSFNL